MATKMMAPNTGLWWFDAGALTTPETPDMDDITPALGSSVDGSLGKNLSKAVMAGYTLNPTGSDTQSSQSIVDKGVGQSRGAANYEGNIPFFREDDPSTNTTSVYLEAYKLFKKSGRMGYWMRRVGKAADVPLAVNDIVDIFYFMSWEPRVTTDANGGPIRFVVPYLPQGFVKTNVAIIQTTPGP